MWSRVASTAVLFALAACTHSALEPGAGNSPGTRTGSILVGGRVLATPVHANARHPDELTTDFLVVVSGSAGFVSTGTVTVRSATGAFPLAFVQDKGLGYWTGSAPSYDEVYALDVVTEEGALEGARIDGPDIHVFSQPEEGATVEPGTSLRVVWERDEKADSATMEIDSTLRRYLVDSGESTIDRQSLAAANPNSLQHTLRVARTMGVSLGGSTEWSATVVNAIDLITPP